MFSRFVIAALVIGAVALPMFAGDNEQTLSATRTCQFTVFVPPILKVGPCVELTDSKSGQQFGIIDVETNDAVTVAISSTNFERQERDCDGKLLDTKDVIAGALTITFNEIVHCEDGGSPMQVKALENNNFKVCTHRGGFQLKLGLNPAAADICDDAGCFTATVTVVITAQPTEACPERQDP